MDGHIAGSRRICGSAPGDEIIIAENCIILVYVHECTSHALEDVFLYQLFGAIHGVSSTLVKRSTNARYRYLWTGSFTCRCQALPRQARKSKFGRAASINRGRIHRSSSYM